jgi:hypothetical protein
MSDNVGLLNTVTPIVRMRNSTHVYTVSWVLWEEQFSRSELISIAKKWDGRDRR